MRRWETGNCVPPPPDERSILALRFRGPRRTVNLLQLLDMRPAMVFGESLHGVEHLGIARVAGGVFEHESHAIVVRVVGDRPGRREDLRAAAGDALERERRAVHELLHARAELLRR